METLEPSRARVTTSGRHRVPCFYSSSYRSRFPCVSSRPSPLLTLRKISQHMDSQPVAVLHHPRSLPCSVQCRQ